MFPVFLVIDVSYSMAGEPIEAVNAALPDLKAAIEDDPTVGELARVAVIAFADTATVVLPLSDLQYAGLPLLEPGGATNFAEAFRAAREEIERAIRGLGRGSRFYRPVLFFMSDGMHVADEDWRGPLRQLTSPDWPFAPEVVAFGFGAAEAEALGTIATRYAFKANGADPAAQAREIISTLVRSIRTTSGSLRPDGDGGLVVDVDRSKFTPLPLMEVRE
ncbi:Uncharacterized conserved protein YegL, contains vWA domain of TerY type [Nonomuraea wenchangensis]|uniref:Uncharacterized conserved protein YegL, contains vWA domain of TerY type n=1 Tax=Nonomuraea wenchangensis TaxID=568860 RepID=A0A1I0BXQ0_9ACTN|nr:Uncharacterized conserved protein YegL, contains vWA domain of TerY type [Nonomuraea wenchangensis]